MAIAGLIVATLVYGCYAKTSVISRHDDRPARPLSAPDYIRDREEARLAHLTDEDRAWESATLQWHRDTQAREDALATQRP